MHRQRRASKWPTERAGVSVPCGVPKLICLKPIPKLLHPLQQLFNFGLGREVTDGKSAHKTKRGVAWGIVLFASKGEKVGLANKRGQIKSWVLCPSRRWYATFLEID